MSDKDAEHLVPSPPASDSPSPQAVTTYRGKPKPLFPGRVPPAGTTLTGPTEIVDGQLAIRTVRPGEGGQEIVEWFPIQLPTASDFYPED